MAEVWSARHRVLGTQRALKVLSHARLSELLLEEGRFQARVDHVNVLPVLDVLGYNDAPVLVMPLVRGPSLRGAIEGQDLHVDECVWLFLAILSGVEAAHQHGIVHRDLKPENVLLHQHNGRVTPKVADFGIAAKIGVKSTTFGGTAEYAAPEQGAGSTASAVDYWALGVMLYELLMSRRPRSGLVLDAPEPFLPLLSALLQPDPSRRLCDPHAIRTQLIELATPRMPKVGVTTHGYRAHTAATVATPVSGSFRAQTGAPRHDDRFIGRAQAIETLCELLRTPGLVTVVGPGGVGKTRISAHILPVLPHGEVHFVDLTDASNADDVVRMVGAALQVPPRSVDGSGRLAAAMAGRPSLLLVLDNFEQVVEDGPATVGTWLKTCPDLTLLITSREPLRLRNERVLRLDVLSLPADGGTEAVDLFVDRAKRADPTFELKGDDARQIGALVTLLDGLPLAIELAAARSQTLSPRQLGERLDDRFKLLVSRERGAAGRHRTLEAAIDWSWSLLEPHERSALAQLSVFEGGWTLDAAEAVVSIEGEWVEDVLAELVDKSLVRSQRQDTGADPRMELLVAVQEFARARLEESGDANETQARHTEWFCTPVEDSHFIGHRGQERVWVALRDLDNLRAAFRWSLAARQGHSATVAASQLMTLLPRVAPVAPLLPQLRELAVCPGANHALAHIHLATALAGIEGEAEVRIHLDRALEMAVKAGDLQVEMRAQYALATALWDTPNPGRAVGPANRALALARQLGLPHWEGRALTALSLAVSSQGDEERSWVLQEQAIDLHRQVGNLPAEAMGWSNLGVKAYNGADHVLTQSYYDKALSLFEQASSRKGRAAVLQNLAALAFEQGDTQRAATRLQQAIRLFRLLGDRRTEGRRQKLMARIHQCNGDLDAADDALSAGESVLRDIDDLVGLGLLLVGRAELRHDQGRAADAAHALDQARQYLGVHPGSSSNAEIARVQSLLDAPPTRTTPAR